MFSSAFAGRQPLHTWKTKPGSKERDVKNANFFLSNRLLAGKIKEVPKDQTAQSRVKAHIANVFESAKSVKVKEKLKMPWENDQKGLRYSSESEKNDFKRKHLRKMLGFAKAGKLRMLNKTVEKDKKELDKFKDIRFVDPDAINTQAQLAIVEAISNTLIPLELENALTKAEKKFRMGLVNWIMGEGKNKEYHKCWWIKEEHQITGKDEENINLPDPKFKAVFAERQKLVVANPHLSRGLVEEHDMLPFKIKVFLDELYRVAPKTHEEAYLW